MVAYLSLVLLTLACFAGDVVELEPVSAYTDNFLCSQYTGAGNTIGSCSTDPVAKAYCLWNTSDCVDDPQLRVLAAGDETSSGSCITISPQSVSGKIIDLSKYLDADCKEAQGTGIICAKGSASASDFNYCIFAWLRDNACPDSICVRNTASGATHRNQCVPSNTQQCNMLSTSTECGRIPKCYWTNSACQNDPCWATGPIASPNTCEGLEVTLPNEGTGKTNECKKFQPWISGEQKDYCVHKSQTNPNICYFGTPGATALPSSDFDFSFPTYNVTTEVSDVICTGSVASCTGGECYTTINTGGAFAGQYCTDGTHGNASILRIPSMLVFLIVSALSLFIL